MKSWVYFARYGSDGPIKIGHSLDPHERVSSLGCGTPVQIILLGAIVSDTADEEENQLQQQLRADHIKGEWFAAAAVLKLIHELGPRVISPDHVTPRLLENGNGFTEDLHIRADLDAVALWKRAARREGLSLSEWMRRKLNVRAIEGAATSKVKGT